MLVHTRRSFLKRLGAIGAASFFQQHLGLLNSGIAYADMRCQTKRKVIVSIFLAGGPHGSSILVPRNLSGYYARHPNLAVQNPLVLDAQHGLHPNLTNLHSLFQAQKLAIGNGSGHPNMVLSHAEDSAAMATGIVRVNGNGLVSGWGARYASTACDSSEIFSLVSLRGNAREVQGEGAPSISAYNLSNYDTPNDFGPLETAFMDSLRKDAQAAFPVIGSHQGMMREAWMLTDDSIEIVRQIEQDFASGPAYPTQTSAIGMQLRDAAKLIRSNEISVQHIFLLQAGYDTHNDQATGLPNLLRELDSGIGDFWTYITQIGRGADVIVQAFGEFGRTMENANGGTDHGKGGILMVLGDRVRGGILGPALTEQNFAPQQQWIEPTFDFREVLSQLVQQHQGVQSDLVLPETFSRIGLQVLRS